jgi:hypothetical protein
LPGRNPFTAICHAAANSSWCISIQACTSRVCARGSSPLKHFAAVDGELRLPALVLRVNVRQVVLLRVEEVHPDQDAVEAADRGHSGGTGKGSLFRYRRSAATSLQLGPAFSWDRRGFFPSCDGVQTRGVGFSA